MTVTDLVFAPTNSFDRRRAVEDEGAPSGQCEDDGALLTRLARAEAQAVAEAYDAHHSAVRAFARRLIGDASAAEDLVHEVFVALPRAMKKFRGQSSLRTFLVGIAVHRARHHVRAASRRRLALARLEREPHAAVLDPEQAARRRELSLALTRALDKLPLEQRVAFVLCEVEERSSRDAAEIASVPEGTLRTRLFHAKRKLREELARGGFQ
jgi:RNA polymerase sigma-70 factor (ECF subfamily)